MRNVLLIGTLPKLLQQRKRAFEASGYRVCIADDVSDAVKIIDEDRCDVVVIGVAIGENDRTQLARTLKRKCPTVKIVCLYLGGIRNAESADAVLQVTPEAQDLVRTVGFLVSA